MVFDLFFYCVTVKTIYTAITQMARQIVDPDPGKDYNTTISAGDPHFEMEKKRNRHRSRPNRRR